VINNIHDKIIALLIKVLDQGRTTYDRSCENELGFRSGTNTAEPQVTVFSWQRRDWRIEWLHRADGKYFVSKGTSEYKEKPSEDKAIGGLHYYNVASFLSMEARAAINEIYILLEVNFGLVDHPEGSVFGNLDRIQGQTDKN
jgi:hypothetical protein